ncbi:MAG: hypothetical protein WC956_10780, partial [bacterium]
MKRKRMISCLVAVAAIAALSLGAVSAMAKDKDNNPPGQKGGPGTNWENPPGAAGGPGASPDVKPVTKPPKGEFCRSHPGDPKCTPGEHQPKPKHHHNKFCTHHPQHQSCTGNPPGPAGGPGAGPNP